MENKFNFNSAMCTTREQSERLLALGLKKETADMTIHIKSDGGWYVTAEPFYEWEDDMNTLPSLEEPEQILPAWSMHRLIEMMPKTIGRYFQYTSNDGCGYMDEDALNMNGGFDEGNIYDSIISCIEWLIKEGYFPKEYLV